MIHGDMAGFVEGSPGKLYLNSKTWWVGSREKYVKWNNL